MENKIKEFQEYIWNFYAENRREFDWRYTNNPYYVLVSEIMLQQTQTARVATKFVEFIDTFPTIQDLAQAQLYDVLVAWQGLGYNRRGRFLHEAAKEIVVKYHGIVPDQVELLKNLPGIGKATAASIAAFAYNKPTVFIETNIRTVFIYCFFKHRVEPVSDQEIMPLVAQSVCTVDPRSWYYALMDYGVYLKKQLPNPSRSSAHHTKQSRFEGSLRQVRGAIIRYITVHKKALKDELPVLLDIESSMVIRAIEGLISDKMVECFNETLVISN